MNAFRQLSELRAKVFQQGRTPINAFEVRSVKTWKYKDLMAGVRTAIANNIVSLREATNENRGLFPGLNPVD